MIHRPAITHSKTLAVKKTKSINWARCGDRLNMFVLHFLMITICWSGEVYRSKFTGHGNGLIACLRQCAAHYNIRPFHWKLSCLIGVWFSLRKHFAADNRKHKLQCNQNRLPAHQHTRAHEWKWLWTWSCYYATSLWEPRNSDGIKVCGERGKRRTLAPVPIDGNFPIAPSKHLIGGIFIIGSRSEGIFIQNFSVAVANCDRPNFTIDSMRAHLSGFRWEIFPDTSLASSPYFYGPETHKHHRKFFSCYFKPFYDVYVNMSCRYRYMVQPSLMSYADECSVIIMSSFLSEWMNGVVRLFATSIIRREKWKQVSRIVLSASEWHFMPHKLFFVHFRRRSWIKRHEERLHWPYQVPFRMLHAHRLLSHRRDVQLQKGKKLNFYYSISIVQTKFLSEI